MPEMREMNGRWRHLELVRRIEFVVFADDPEDRDEALAALAFARHMEDRIRLWALVAAFATYLTLMIVFPIAIGAAFPASMSIAFILAFVVAITVELGGKERARRLAARAKRALGGNQG